ncbi:MAG: TRAFs-binding domain-containing protein, partial [Stellaceae bacterium]
MKPLCFVLMPFGRKPNEQGQLIDFDAVYQQVIAPAVSQADLEGIRADEERVGGTIHKPMFERLMLCEYAIADVTIANPNVYYELGIRHAMRPRSTVLLSASGTRLPFDLALARSIHYSLNADGLPSNAEDDAHAIAKRLVDLGMVKGPDSPVFQLVDGLKAVKIAHEKTDVFRERALYSNEIKNRLKSARALGGKEAIAALEKIANDPTLPQVEDADSGIVVDLLLSYRAVDGYQQMVGLYKDAAPELQRVSMVQEQYA